ncbi:MAG: lysophospholipid acyltransferase family protein [Solirubrobacterales bacterium]
MAEIKPQVYKDDRPAEFFEKFHRRARDQRPGYMYSLVRSVVTPICLFLYRTRAIGTENVPRTGPVLIVPNHFSQMDHFFAGVYLWRKLRIMAKSQLFGPPVLTWIIFHGGIFPVRRGVRDEEAFETVRVIFEQGGAVMVYAEGGRSRTAELGEPKPGVGRMALDSGIPVVPVAIYGSAGIRGWRKFRFPAVTIRYGEPLTFPVEPGSDRDRQLEVANEIFDRVKEMYGDFQRLGRKGALAAAKAREREVAGSADQGR